MNSSPYRSRSPQKQKIKWQQRSHSLHVDTNSFTNGYHDRHTSFQSMDSPEDTVMEVPPSPCGTSITSSPPSPPGSVGSHSGTFSVYYPTRGGSPVKVHPSLHGRNEQESQHTSRMQQGSEMLDDSILMPPPNVIRSPYSNGDGDVCASNYCTPTNSIGGHSSSLETTPVCTPDAKSRRNCMASREDSFSSCLTSSTTSSSSSFAFYTPKRSPRAMVGQKISFSTPIRSNTHSALLQRNKKSTATSPLSDRFIPSRATSNLNFSVWDCDLDQERDALTFSGSEANSPSDIPLQNDDRSYRLENSMGQNTSSQPSLLNMLLRSEVLGENIDPTRSTSAGTHAQFVRHVPQHRNGNRSPLTEGGNFLRYNGNQRQEYRDSVFGDVSNNPTAIVDSFSLSPVRMSSNQLLMSMPQKSKRKIAKVPFKVLDAPALADDFYLNLVDWSSQNVLAVGLGSCVYLWSASTSKVTKLCDLSEDSSNPESATVTSLAWTQKGTHLAVGVSTGKLQFWDAINCKMIRTLWGHSARIGALSWCGPTLASGSRDRLIYLRDMRVQQPFTAKLASHKQEVCGLKWSFDEPSNLASGGNDNKLLVWDIKNHRQEVHRFSDHTAAVKAITWSPHQHGLLASGGGTADRCIRFWNALSGSALNAIDTGSQVCNLAWSQNCNEIVSTHGYSLNQIAIWKYPTMQKVATLTGHTYRVLYLAMSPDGSSIVTGAGDETLRFWQVFPGPRSHDKNSKSGLLFPSSPYSILR
jgi:FOG: WD40 repeat